MKIQQLRQPVRGLLLGVFLVIAAMVYSYHAQAATGQLPIPKGVMMKSWHDNGQGGKYLLQLAPGSALNSAKPVAATVTGDANCDADAQGLSHCHNTVRLASGASITLINTHEMHRYRCLGEGDKVTLIKLKGQWVMAALPKE